jgi:hypothetical protein
LLSFLALCYERIQHMATLNFIQDGISPISPTLIHNDQKHRWEIRLDHFEELIPDYRHLLWKSREIIGLTEHDLSCDGNTEASCCFLLPYTNDEDEIDAKRITAQKIIAFIQNVTLTVMSLDPLNEDGTVHVFAILRLDHDKTYQIRGNVDLAKLWQHMGKPGDTR